MVEWKGVGPTVANCTWGGDSKKSNAILFGDGRHFGTAWFGFPAVEFVEEPLKMPAWDDVVKHPRRFRTVGLDAVFDTAREVNDIPLLANRSPIAQHQLYFAFQYVEYLILILVIA